LSGVWADAVDVIRHEFELGGGRDWDSLFTNLRLEGGATAYSFACRHCGKIGGDGDIL
jgi:uncharacterized protein CbrC (UPF0167 family)